MQTNSQGRQFPHQSAGVGKTGTVGQERRGGENTLAKGRCDALIDRRAQAEIITVDDQRNHMIGQAGQIISLKDV